MSEIPDITVTVIMHREGALALPALSSMRDLVERAGNAGLNVQTQAVLDRPDDLTRHMVAARGGWLDAVQEVSVGDLGLARNAGVASARGKFLAFLDGDDLWGEDWLACAHRMATEAGAPTEAIWHPQALYYFVESDFRPYSVGTIPHGPAQSGHMFHNSSNALGFNRDILFLENTWSANVLTLRDIHLRFPYSPVDRIRGFGIEDWSWNMETLWAGIPHLVVPETVHLIRVKETGSLGRQNSAEGLLPYLPHGAVPQAGRRADAALAAAL